MNAIKSKYTDGLFGQVHYHYCNKSGSKAALIFINPRTRSGFPLVKYLSPERPLFFIDVPAYGNSAPPTKVPAMSEVAACIIDVMNAEGLEQAHLCGVHTGAKLTVACALANPGRILSATICGKSHSIIPGHERRNKAIRDQLADSKPDYTLLMMETFYADDPAGQTGRQLVYEANFAHDLGGEVSRLQCPVQVVEFASADEDARHGRQASALAELAAQGTAVELDQMESLGTDMYCGGEKFAKTVEAFISNN